VLAPLIPHFASQCDRFITPSAHQILVGFIDVARAQQPIDFLTRLGVLGIYKVTILWLYSHHFSY
jgi:hypothetical protein